MSEAQLREALKALVALDGELKRVRQREREPIAVVGLSVRSPFESHGLEMWDGLARGVDATREIPWERWGAARASAHESVRRGSFLSDVANFDANFFSIAPVEAAGMDPQQRLVLELAWEALADAGAVISALRKSHVGVFMGLCAVEYADLAVPADLPDDVARYLVTGLGPSVIAGRVSYALGLTGPSLTIDTACSSSLVSVHLACESLRLRSSDVALAGGVNLIVSPRSTGRFAALGALSAEGRCRSFDATGTGYGRGEGGGMIVLKRLSDALRDGDRILAQIRGSAVNQDGRSDGLTAPNGRAQQEVIRSALSFADLTPSDVQYVEAHGTGTVLGDPIEVEALNEVFGAGHSKSSPLAIGSLKSNIGHLEGAAGISGIIKTILAIQHRELPPSLHFETPNPHIAWDDIALRVQTKLGSWPAPNKPLIAGVSSFGISGTNAHVLVSEPPPAVEDRWKEADRLAAEAKPLPLCLSAKTPEALRAYAKRYAERLAAPLEDKITWRDIAFTSAVRRTHLEHRAVVVGANPSEWQERLLALANGEVRPGIVDGDATRTQSQVVFVFPGQGSQWLGMGSTLIERSQVFREHIERCEQAFSAHVDWSLQDELRASEATSRMKEIDVVQPMLFAMQTGLAAMWADAGVVPNAVVGHSMGEVAAACVAGALTLEDAARVICIRSKLLRRVRGRGAMAAIEMTMAEAEVELARYGGKLSVAASNGSQSTVVAGDSQAIAALLEELKDRVFCRAVKVDVASHSSQVDELRDDLVRQLSELKPRQPTLRFVSTCMVDATTTTLWDAAYWWSNLREPVRLSQRVSELITEGHELFVELSPHPVLTVALDELLRGANIQSKAVASLRREEPEVDVMLEALGALHAVGYPVDWKKLFGAAGRVVSLPSYPWQRERYWLPLRTTSARKAGSKWALVHAHVSPNDQPGRHVFEAELQLDDEAYGYLADHKVHDGVWFPGAGFIELALQAGHVAFEGLPVSVEHVTLSHPLMMREGEAVLVQLLLTKEGQGGTFRIASSAKGEASAWTEHASGRLVASQHAATREPKVTLGDVRKRCSREVNAGELYEAFSARGISYGPAFQGIGRAWAARGEALAELVSLDNADGYILHPSLLDAAFQTLFVATRDIVDSHRTYVPSTITRCQTFGRSPPRWAHVKVRSVTGEALSGDVRLLDENGTVVAEVEALRAVPLSHANRLDPWLFELAWRSSELEARGGASDEAGRWLLFGDRQGVANDLRAWLVARGVEVVTVARGDGFTREDAAHYVLNPLDPSAMSRLMKEAFGESAPTRVVHLLALDTRETADVPLADDVLRRAQELTCTSTLHLVQAISQMSWSVSPRLFVVTRRCQPVNGSGDVRFPEQALAWGFGATVMHEAPELATTLVDLDEGTTAESLGRALVAADEESRVALRAAERMVARLARHRRAEVAQRPLTVSAEETYLITGGLGGLGLVIAKRLATLGAKHLALLGRSAPSERAMTMIHELEASGVQVHVLRADVGERQSLAQAIAELGRSAPPVAGFVHAAGVLDDATLANLTASRIPPVLAPKTLGALALDALLPAAAWRVYFASVAGVLGSAGQAHYAAANTFLDAFAHYQATRSGQAMSLDWGIWGEVGLATGAVRSTNVTRQGLAVISPEDGAELFERALSSPVVQLMSVPIDFRQWRSANPQLAGTPFLREVSAAAAPAQKNAGLFGRLREVSSDSERAVILEQYVRVTLAGILRSAPDRVPRSAPFKQLGLDSLMTVAFKNVLERDLGIQLSAAMLFKHPSVERLALFLAAELAQRPTAAKIPAVVEPAPPERTRGEAIAIVGMASRMPFESQGVGFWEGLARGVDASRDVPADRWDADAFSGDSGKVIPKRASFLADVAHFDAKFFEIAPVEAQMMDPQQRLVLEVVWEALADAGATLATVRQARTGVFLGACMADYGALTASGEVPEAHAPYWSTGRSPAVIAGRVSYALGMTGPSLVVDTACSSSLVAVHLACDSLRLGTSDVAVVGGVNLIVAPATHVSLSKLGALSADGRCRSFDASGTGYGRGEGCGIVVLKRLSDAVRDGDRVMAVIRGSSVSQDGRSDGLTAPNGAAQEEMMRSALAAAKVAPSDVQYVEAHGTGTILGDPIEVEALSEVYGKPHSEGIPLVIGSVKSNLGHLEGAAGISGLIKTVLSIKHRQLPPSLHFKTPNPHIPWSDLAIRVQTKLDAWPEPEKELIAAVSSFGLSGTIAHAILSEAPTVPADSSKEADRLAGAATLLPLCVSAKTPSALREYAQRYADFLSAPLDGATWRDVGFTSCVRQTHLDHRLVIVGSSASDWADKLRAYAKGESRRGLVAGSGRSRSRVVFVFPGQGSQWFGMGRALLEASAVFREQIERCEAALRPFVDWSLREQLLADESTSRMKDIDVIQPTLFAFQVALTAVWESYGVVPSAVLGHSMGEVAGAYVAGALSLEDAARVICTRSRLARRIRGAGLMATLELSMAETESELASYAGSISVAASNGPRSTVVSGESAAVESLVSALTKREIFCRLVKVDFASHSAQVDVLRDDLLRELSPVRGQAPKLRFVSTALPDGGVIPSFDAAYWWTNLREPVRLSQRASELIQSEHEIFVEVSPHPVLTMGLEECLRAADTSGAAIASLRREEPAPEVLLESLGALHAAGYPVDWRRVYPVPGRVVSVPSYPWQRERYWLPISKSASRRSESKWSLVHRHYASSDQVGKHVFEVELDLGDTFYAYLGDHKVRGRVWLPGAAYLEMALQSARIAFEGKVSAVEELRLVEPIVIDEGQPVLVQLVMQPAEAGVSPFRIAARLLKGDGAWTEHATGRVALDRAEQQTERVSLAELQQRCTRVVDVSGLYDAALALGIAYGPAFQGLERVWAGQSEALSVLAPLEKLVESTRGDLIHPAVLDAAFQTVSALTDGALSAGRAYVPSSVGSFIASGMAGSSGPHWVHVKARPAADEAVEIDVRLFDEKANVVAEVKSLRIVPLDPAGDRLDPWVYEQVWRPSSATAFGPMAGRWLLLAGEQGLAARLKSSIEARGGKVVIVTRGHGGQPLEAASMQHVLQEAFGKSAPTHVVHLWSLDTRKAVDEPLDEAIAQRAYDLTCTSTLHLAQALEALAWPEPPRLFTVTRSCQPAKGSGDVRFPEQALAWGFCATLAHEQPGLRPTLIDLDEATTADTLVDELARADKETRVALRAGERMTPRLVRYRRSTRPSRGILDPNQTYLVTGGLGGLGPVIAKRLIALGAKQVALLGRSAPSEAASTILRELEETGAKVHVVRADVANREELREAFAQLARSAPPIAGVIHAAAVLDDAVISNLTAGRMWPVVVPKVLGALALESVLPDLKMRVYFASVAGVLGSAGQAHYAAANAFLDAFAHQVSSRSERALAIDWGAWGEVGSVTRGARMDNVSRQGLTMLTSEEGADLFERALFSPPVQLMLAPVDFQQWRHTNQHVAAMPFLGEVIASSTAQRNVGLLQRCAAAPSERARLEVLREYLVATVASILRAPPTEVSRSAPFKQLGFDSLMTVALKNTLERDLALPMTVAIVFQYPTVERLAAFLATKVEGATKNKSRVVAEPADEPVAATLEVDTVTELDADTATEDEIRALVAERLQRLERADEADEDEDD